MKPQTNEDLDLNAIEYENNIDSRTWQQGLNDEYAQQAQFEELLK